MPSNDGARAMHPETLIAPRTGDRRRGPQDPPAVRWTLTILAVAIITWLVVIPVVSVFWQAFGNGFAAYWKSLTSDYETRHSIWMTLTVAPVAVSLNVVFGVAAAWAITKFH